MASPTHEASQAQARAAMSAWHVPFNRPSIEGRELEYVAAALGSDHLSGDGPFTRQCQALLETELGVGNVLLTTSCTHALEMSALLLDIEPGDEVIVPSFTFVSTANAFVLRGAKPVFIDIRADTMNFDERQFEALITPRTKVAIPVHYAGVGCEMSVIMPTAQKHGVAIVEDNAHGLFGRYQGQFLGTFGSLAAQSFHETKNFSCGEGGALLINDSVLVARAEILREKGTDRSRYFRGAVDKYTWRDVGSSYLPSDLLAAVLFGQLEVRESIQSRRRRLWYRYWSALQDWASSAGVTLPVIPSDRDSAYHLFHLVLPTAESRQRLINRLRARGILSVFHYIPLHLSAMGQKFGGREGQCPVSEHVSECLLRLPFYNSMADGDQDLVIEAIRDFEL
jgi:dTDP-4-amino-4,6-dideoxygalactose transaminase